MNNEQTMKTSFLLFLKKVVFENTKNTKNKNTPPSPNKFFVFFVFQEQKTVLENRNQTNP